MKLQFYPARDGYHFVNSFTNHPVGGLPITTEGLCGGMVMSALDYWRSGIPVPTHEASDFGPEGLPAEGSRLRTYIYDRQMNSLLTKFMFTRWTVFPWVRPEDFHDWAIGSEFALVRQQIDRGRPAMLGLWSLIPGDAVSGHQVLCYGYDENPRRLHIYDPNHPDEECDLVPVSPAEGCQIRLAKNGSVEESYRGYFYTDVYNWDEPPYVPRYYDLAVANGLALNPSGDNVTVGAPLDCSVTVENMGEYPARFQYLFIWTRGPHGENFDPLLGGAELGLTVLHPGEQRLITRRAPTFGDQPGNYIVGVSYLSNQHHWHGITAGPPGTTAQQPVTLRAVNRQVVDKVVTIRESDFDVATGVTIEPGDEFALTANGSIWAGVWFTGSNGPEGWMDRIERNPQFPLHDTAQAHPFALLGRFDGSAYFYIGREWPRQAFTDGVPQRLWLRINDNVPANGSAHFSVVSRCGGNRKA